MKMSLPFGSPDCLSNATIDVLVLAAHRFKGSEYTGAMDHLRACTTCQARCVNRARRIMSDERSATVRLSGWNDSFSVSRFPSGTAFSGIGACLAAVSILGIALLSPMFIRGSHVGITRAQTVKPSEIDDAPQKSETPRSQASELREKRAAIGQHMVSLINQSVRLRMLRAELSQQFRQAKQAALKAQSSKPGKVISNIAKERILLTRITTIDKQLAEIKQMETTLEAQDAQMKVQIRKLETSH